MINIPLLNFYKSHRNKILGLMYVILYAVAFLQRLGNYSVNYFIKYIIASCWILIALVDLKAKKEKVIKYESDIRFYLKLFITPVIFLAIYNLFLFSTGIAEYKFVGRGISNIVTMLITVLSSFATIYLLEEKTLNYTSSSIALSFFVVILYNLFTLGPSIFTNAFYALINSTNVVNVFEIHDLTFAVGLILLACIFYRNEFTDQELKGFYLAVIIMLMGFKRIQLLAIIIIFIYMFILRRFEEKLRSKLIMLTGFAVFLFCYAYVFIIKFGYLNNLINKMGINTMGRITFYNWIRRYFEFNPKYMGIGLGATSKMMQLYTKWPIATIHSDILRMFVELGFVAFGIWAGYYLVYCFRLILKRYTLIEAEFYFVLILYLFLLHFTDNTVNYFTTQYVFMILVTVFTIRKKYRMEN